jgi:hypothetical protein
MELPAMAYHGFFQQAVALKLTRATMARTTDGRRWCRPVHGDFSTAFDSIPRTRVMMIQARHLILFFLLTAFWFGSAQVAAQRSNRGSSNVYQTRIDPHWIGEGEQFWYRNDLHDSEREFVWVDAARGQRKPAFDHVEVAAALTDSGIESDPKKLPFRELEFDLAKDQVSFSADGRTWDWNLKTSKLSPGKPISADESEGLPPLAEFPRRSARGAETNITFINQTKQTVEIFWVNPGAGRTSYAKLKPAGVHEQHTFAGHVWQVVGDGNRSIAFFQATPD